MYVSSDLMAKLPSPHPSHEEAAVKLWNFPKGHEVQCVAADTLVNLPTSHGKHSGNDSFIAEYFPLTHALQVPLASYPGLHLHELAPELPGFDVMCSPGHDVHPAISSTAVLLLYVPGGHCVQELELISTPKVPCGQGMHGEEELRLKYPLWQRLGERERERACTCV